MVYSAKLDTTMTTKDLDRITHYKLLTKEEEQELCLKASKGDEEAIKTLVEKNLRLVVHVGKQYVTSRLSLGDIISLGTIGLFQAARKFKPSKGTRFSTYAVIWIKNELRKAYYDQKSNVITVPKWICSIEKKQRIGESLTEGEQFCLERAEAARKTVGNLQNTNTINMFCNYCDQSDVASEIVRRKGVLAVDQTDIVYDKEEESLFEPEDLDNLQVALGKLIPADREIISARFGIAPFIKAHTLKEVGDMRGLTKERIRQLQGRAMERLSAVFMELRKP